MSDEIIYERLLRQDQQAFVDIIEKYGGLIKYIINGTVALTFEEIEKCVSDVLFLLWKRIEKYDNSKSTFKSWLILVTRAVAIDYYRKIEKYRKTVLYEDVSSTIVFQEEFEQLTFDNIIGLLQMLPPPDNAIFYDRFILGENIENIAKKHDISKVRLDFKATIDGESNHRVLKIVPKIKLKEGFNYYSVSSHGYSPYWEAMNQEGVYYTVFDDMNEVSKVLVEIKTSNVIIGPYEINLE